MTTYFLLRHGPTDAGKAGAPLGRLDLPVNAAGQALWPRVKEDLLGLGIQRVLTSNLARAREHARDLGLPCRVLPDLAEQHFGAWDGVPWCEIKGAEAFFKDPVRGVPAGGGESYFRCADRARAAIEGTWDPLPVTLVLAHGGPLRAIFIRAPWIERAGSGVEVLAELDGHPVAAREGNIWAVAFHPELGQDTRLHELFAAAASGRGQADS